MMPWRRKWRRWLIWHGELLLDFCLYYSGLVKLARWWTQRSGPKLVILCYHEASGGYLGGHMLYLSRHYRVLHLEAALEELYALPGNKRPSHDGRPLLALTFDDGCHDLYTCGMPLACAFHIPITLFLAPGYIENERRFWWTEPGHLLRSTKVSEATLQERTYRLDKKKEQEALYQAIYTGLHNASSLTEREAFLQAAYKVLNVPLSLEPTGLEKDHSPLSWDEVHKMEKCAWISYGAHTMHHPVLSCLASETDMHYEVEECRATLETQLQRSIKAFAYPMGRSEDIGEKGVMIVKAAGYKWAVTAIHGLNTPRTNPYVLHRFVVGTDQHWLMIAAKASGLWDCLTRPGWRLWHSRAKVLRARARY